LRLCFSAALRETGSRMVHFILIHLLYHPFRVGSNNHLFSTPLGLKNIIAGLFVSLSLRGKKRIAAKALGRKENPFLLNWFSG